MLVELRYRTNQLIFLFAENFWLGWRQRCDRISDVDEISCQVDQVSTLTGVILALRLLREFDSAGAIGESAAGVMIDKSRHGGVPRREFYLASAPVCPASPPRFPQHPKGIDRLSECLQHVVRKPGRPE
jgi:hypothetical protein